MIFQNQQDISMNHLQDSNEIYKWGVYTKKIPDKLFDNNITFLGDAAHPMVPFLRAREAAWRWKMHIFLES